MAEINTIKLKQANKFVQKRFFNCEFIYEETMRIKNYFIFNIVRILKLNFSFPDFYFKDTK